MEHQFYLLSKRQSKAMSVLLATLSYHLVNTYITQNKSIIQYVTKGNFQKFSITNFGEFSREQPH